MAHLYLNVTTQRSVIAVAQFLIYFRFCGSFGTSLLCVRATNTKTPIRIARMRTSGGSITDYLICLYRGVAAQRSMIAVPQLLIYFRFCGAFRQPLLGIRMALSMHIGLNLTGTAQ